MKIPSTVQWRATTALGLTLALMAVSTVAVADAPIVTITAPVDGLTAAFETTEFPYTLPVAGTISHVGSSNEVVLLVSVNDELMLENGFNEPDNVAWSFDYSVTAPGIYVITAEARHGQWGRDSVTVEMTAITVSVDYPAGPSVANQLLRSAGVSSRYGTNRSGGNCIADVAQHMGDGTDFNGVAKDDSVAYAAAVEAFLDGISHNGTSPCSVSGG